MAYDVRTKMLKQWQKRKNVTVYSGQKQNSATLAPLNVEYVVTRSVLQESGYLVTSRRFNNGWYSILERMDK